MEVAQKLLLVGISGAKIDDDDGDEDDEDEDEDEDEDDNGPWQGRGRRRGAEAAARTIGRPRHTKSIVLHQVLSYTKSILPISIVQITPLLLYDT